MLKNNTINKILWIFVSIFLLLLILSFTKLGKKSGDKRTPLETTLLNPKNISSLDYFELSSTDSFLILKKTDSCWILISDNNSPMPVDNEIINNFINDLSSVKKVYKISDNMSNENRFGFNDKNFFKIRYFLQDGTASELIFGNEDFSLSYRYFMTGQSLKVYQIDDAINKYLTTSIQNWSDPYLISKAVCKNLKSEDIQSIKINYTDNTINLTGKNNNFNDFSQKLLDLRHGGNGNQSVINQKTPVMTIKIETGIKNTILMEAFEPESDSNDYIFRITYFDYSTKSNQTYYSKVSVWTYNKIKEMTL